MFRQSFAIARQFTWPILLSRKAASGRCTSGIGALVVINDEGWFVTAFHMLDQFRSLADSEAAAKAAEAQIDLVKNDPKLSAKEKKRQLAGIKSPKGSDTVRGSAWWGRDGAVVQSWAGIPVVDLAVGQIQPFDPSWVSNYPVFKDPTRDFEPGTSLCKLGFPFHDIAPHYDDTREAFVMPQGTVPLPLFPLEGILTRFADIGMGAGPSGPVPMLWIETSSPGLKGQSGGPIFDSQAPIWGIQVNTAHYPLGFNPEVRSGAGTHREHQFLNVGRGVHAATLIAVFDQVGIKYQKSAY